MKITSRNNEGNCTLRSTFFCTLRMNSSGPPKKGKKPANQNSFAFRHNPSTFNKKHSQYAQTNRIFCTLQVNNQQTNVKKLIKPHNYWKKRDNQIHFMEELYKTLNLNSLEEWCTKISLNRFYKEGGAGILRQFNDKYSNLLTNIYPNFPWDFITTKHKPTNFWKSIDNQKQFLDNLFIQLKFQNLEDFLKLPKKTLKVGGGFSILEQYKGDIRLLLQTVYPHYNWKFYDFKRFLSVNDWKKLEFQQYFMDDLFKKLKLTSLDDWLEINPYTIQRDLGGKTAKKIFTHYKYDLLLFYQTIYPNYPWEFDLSKIKLKYQKNSNFDAQKFFMNFLYCKLKLKSLNDFIKIRKVTLRENGASQLLAQYNNDYRLLLKTIFPDHIWDFGDEKKPLKYWTLIENQREFMDELYKKFELNHLEDWAEIAIRKVMKNGGKSIVQFYNNNFKLLLQSVYPNYPWKFQLINFKFKSYLYWYSLENQRNFMNNLYRKWKFQSLDDWLIVNKKMIKRNGGYTLIDIYKNDYKALLSAIYPHHNWNIDRLKYKPIHYWKSIENQRKFLDQLFVKLQLKDLSDWLVINKQKVITENGGSTLLKYYKNDIQKLFRTNYSNYKIIWENKGEILAKEKLRELQFDFNIQQKKDWYRINTFLMGDLIGSLKLVYPNENWQKKDFLFRSKKSKQRILYLQIQKLLKNYYMIENYRSPLILSIETDREFELDIFIPSLNVAFEYQGQQHYDDIASGFSPYEYYHSCDLLKKQLSIDQKLNFIEIPYWWNGSLSTLFSTISPLLTSSSPS